jgi:hypothetical protein
MMFKIINGDAMPLSSHAYLRIVRASAWYDLIVTAPFFTPWSFACAREQLSMLNVRLGGAPLPAFDAFHTLFVCLMGSVVLVWSLARLHMPSIALGRYDGVARLLFSLWMAWALAMTGAPLLWLFLAPECAWGLAQFLPVQRTPRQRGAA